MCNKRLWKLSFTQLWAFQSTPVQRFFSRFISFWRKVYLATIFTICLTVFPIAPNILSAQTCEYISQLLCNPLHLFKELFSHLVYLLFTWNVFLTLPSKSEASFRYNSIFQYRQIICLINQRGSVHYTMPLKQMKIWACLWSSWFSHNTKADGTIAETRSSIEVAPLLHNTA